MMNLESGEFVNMQALAVIMRPLAPGRYLTIPSLRICNQRWRLTLHLQWDNSLKAFDHIRSFKHFEARETQ